ncbi:unnamed protein product [Rotaria sordida]|uniref:Uncharacterized protein n=1 Tax=Rotaria sordida TaxID=392033 RepID=A0A813U428_9BILA|nr:unnamed protein product [Rotaria sordida]CAF3551716.1 unnamed protein product [Rotaria sordida]
MRLSAALALVLVSIALVQCQLVVPQFSNLNALNYLLRPQIQNFRAQLDKILPQIANILSSFELQSLKDKITQVVLTQLGGKLDLNAIKDKLRPVLQQFLASKPQARIDFDAILDYITNAAASTLPSIVLDILGKREVTDDRVDLGEVLSVFDKLSLDTFIPQIHQFLNDNKFQQLQQQFFSTVLTAVGQHWSLPNLAQALEQLVAQFVPGVSQMRIDWEAIGQSALNGLVTAVPGILIGALSLFGKREVTDARVDLGEVLSVFDKLSLDTFIPQIHQFLNDNKFHQLQQQFFSTVLTAIGQHWSLPNLAQALQQLVAQFVPGVSQMRIDWENLAQTALNGVATALPSILTGVISLFG